MLCQHIQIAENTLSGVKSTITNKAIHDFEDGLEYYAALESKCECIITEDVKDFYFSDIEVISAENFFEKYLTRKNRSF